MFRWIAPRCFGPHTRRRASLESGLLILVVSFVGHDPTETSGESTANGAAHVRAKPFQDGATKPT